MTTATLNALNASAVRSAPQFRKLSFLEIRAALPDMPEQGGFAARAGSVMARVAVAAVPFGAIGWMFLAH